MRENRTSGSEGGEAQTNELSLPLSLCLPAATWNVKLGRPWPAPREVHHSSMSGRRSGRNCLRAGHCSS